MARKKKSDTPGYTTSVVGSTGKDQLGRSVGTATEVTKATDDQAKAIADAEFIQAAKSAFDDIESNPDNREIREGMQDDLRFYVGQQWPDTVATRMRAIRRPIVTVNKVKPACRQVINSMMQDRPDIKIVPVDSYSDPKTAEILQGIIRHVEVNSMADVALDTGLNGQVIHGMGFIRMHIDFPHPFSMTPEIYIDEVEDPFSVYMGSYDRVENLNEVFIVKDYTHAQYESEFGKATVASANSFMGVGNDNKGWMTRDSIRVVEYLYRKFRTATIVEMSDGTVIEKDRVPDHPMFKTEEEGGENAIGIVAERETEIPTVHWCVFNAVEKLREIEWPGLYIPVIPFYGDKQIVNGKTVLCGIVRDAKDAQRQYNYFRSKMTEVIALAPMNPFIMAEGQDKNHEKEWRDANVELRAVLRYTPVTVAGQPAPPPQRNFGEPPIQSMVLAANQYEDDIKATTQVYDAKLGAKSNEVSGRAIATRKAQSDTGNYTYTNNFVRGLRWMGVQLLDLIPKVYESKTVARIIGLDNQVSRVNITNDQTAPAYDEKTNPAGDIEKIYNIGVGQYDVMVGMGASYLTKRQEAFDMLTKLANSMPDIMAAGSDIIVGLSDIPDASTLAARLKKVIQLKMPGVADDDPNSLPPKVQQALQQLTQQNQMLQAQVQQLTKVLEEKKIEAQQKLMSDKQDSQLESQTELQVASIQAETAKQVAALKAKTDELKLMMQFQTDQMNNKMSMLDTMISSMAKMEEAKVKTQQMGMQMDMKREQHQMSMAQKDEQHSQSLAHKDQQHKQQLKQQASKPKPTGGK